MRSLNFSSDNLAVQWQYVKRNLGQLGVLYQFDDFEFQARGVIQKLIQDCVNEEFALQIRAQRYEHASSRLGQRQGGYERNLTTTFGTSRIRIPRVRFNKIKVRYSLFEKYQRRQKKFDRMVLLSMLLGHSVRKQRRFFRAFLGDAVSHTTASRLVKSLEGDLQYFRTKPLQDIYKYLVIDGLWVKVYDGRLKDMVILFALGITLDNKKEIIAFKLAKGETEEEVTVLLNDLYRRGLEGRNLKLIASDGAKGIRAAINMVYPYAKWQLCYVHKLRNLIKHIRYKQRHRKSMMHQAGNIYDSKTKREAIKRFEKFCARWRECEPYAVKCFSSGFLETLHYFEFADDKNMISSTNHLERYLEEVRRRIKIQGYFKSSRSANLWVYGIISQVMQEEQPEVMPRHITFFREPQYESVQFS
ncbi:MAG: IS256 family transposase [Candidatus Omnitrophica bacterium]|nr:IS256 family transposase [Candidatus Omnitrophota bacterium]